MKNNKKPRINYPIGGYAPGNYCNMCVNCSGEFVGDKLAVQCEICAINSLIESHRALSKKMFDMKSLLE